ncbi:MAG: DUF3494 domain-containing protein [Acidobacteriia bacterium]|nr:DUF3494 domain-containing protein [Terriglobia bacterium]
MKSLCVCLLLLPLLAFGARADTLNTADSFAVLAGSTVTNAGVGVLGATVVNGSLGVSPGSTCSGFGTCPTTGPGTVINGTVHLADGVALQAQSDLTTAFTTLQALGLGGSLVPGGVLSGTYAPGVYFAPAASLTGKIFLNDGGVAGSQFIFYTPSTLITAPDSAIDVSGLSPSDGLFWVVGSSATLGDNTVFYGNILALTDINFDPGATIGCGRALARNGQVTFAGQNATTGIENLVSIGCEGTTGEGGGGFNGSGGGPGPAPVPELSSLPLVATGLAALVGSIRRKLLR